MAQFDPAIPPEVIKQVQEDMPHSGTWNEELQALLSPSVEAKPLHIPMSGRIRKILNTEYEYYWARDLCGQNPDHSRIEELRAVGFEFATTKDVTMSTTDTVKGEGEIRSGDRRLMKIPKERWLEVRKDQLLQSLAMTNPRNNGPRSPMGSTMIPGVKTYISTESVEELRGKAIVSDATEELATGSVKGNASVAKIHKEN